MKATDLKQILHFFDPRRPLSGVELRLWYVPRPGSPRQRLRILLEAQADLQDPQKFLLVGHRGSGKTTELNKLSSELEDSFHTIGFNVLEITGRTTPEYEDLMLAISTQVTRYCMRHADRSFTNDKEERRLLYNGSLIEYPNDIPWCDAHPVLWPLLETTEDDDTNPSQ